MNYSLHRFLTIWYGAKRDEGVPFFTDIDFDPIRDLVADSFMLLREGSTLSYLYAGTRHLGRYGQFLEGSPYLTPWRGKDYRELESGLKSITRAPLVGYTRHMGYPAGQESGLELETLYLPVQVLGESAYRICAVMTAKSSPHWLGRRPLIFNRTRGYNICVPGFAFHNGQALSGGKVTKAAPVHASGKGPRTGGAPDLYVIDGQNA